MTTRPFVRFVDAATTLSRLVERLEKLRSSFDAYHLSAEIEFAARNLRNFADSLSDAELSLLNTREHEGTSFSWFHKRGTSLLGKAIPYMSPERVFRLGEEMFLLPGDEPEYTVGAEFVDRILSSSNGRKNYDDTLPDAVFTPRVLLSKTRAYSYDSKAPTTLYRILSNGLEPKSPSVVLSEAMLEETARSASSPPEEDADRGFGMPRKLAPSVVLLARSMAECSEDVLERLFDCGGKALFECAAPLAYCFARNGAAATMFLERGGDADSLLLELGKIYERRGEKLFERVDATGFVEGIGEYAARRGSEPTEVFGSSSDFVAAAAKRVMDKTSDSAMDVIRLFGLFRPSGSPEVAETERRAVAEVAAREETEESGMVIL